MNWKKRVASLMLAVCFVIGMFPAMASAVDTEETNSKQSASMPFTDVKAGSWYYDAVEYVYQNDLM
ncbi:MAG: hypothetical protein LUE11_12370, partial [Clostridia bacterium]|nr:hypothetical protein [Clostridia bacterium]